MNVYPRVRVTGASGYEDFEGELILEVPRADGVMVCIIGCDHEGHGKDVHVIDSVYVEVIDLMATGHGGMPANNPLAWVLTALAAAEDERPEGRLGGSQSKLTPTQRDEIVQRKADGESPMSIATEYGVTASYVRSL